MRWLAIAACVLATASTAAADEKFVRVGLLGMDNYQGLAYAELFNRPTADGELAGVKITVALPTGSDDYPDSQANVDRWKATFARFGNPAEKAALKDFEPVEMVDSIDALLAKCDAVVIGSMDGRQHLREVEPVLRAGKRLYVIRPLAASLADAAAIFKLAEQYQTPMFSCSQHRFVPGFSGMREHPEVGKVLGCDVYGAFDVKGPKADDFIRPLHSLETIYTIMGPGVATVTCTSTPVAESYTLVWNDGRVGTFRGIKEGAVKYSATVFGDKGVSTAGVYGHGVPVKGRVPTQDKYMGYEGISRQIGKFFKGGPAPVSPDETLEIFAVMEAAERSKVQGGAAVSVAEVLNSVRQ